MPGPGPARNDTVRNKTGVGLHLLGLKSARRRKCLKSGLSAPPPRCQQEKLIRQKHVMATMASFKNSEFPGQPRLTPYNRFVNRSEEGQMKAEVEEILDRIRPMLMADGGNIELIDVKDGEVFVHLVGACGMCPSSSMTLKLGVERALKEALPEVKRVVQV